MQSTTRFKKFLKRNQQNELQRLYEDSALDELADSIKKNVGKMTHASVHSLRVDTEHDRVKISGLCESYYIKQLAQQAVLKMTTNEEIINEILVT
jgi:hypothetical protein